MGFLRRILIILTVLALSLFSCSKPLILQKYRFKKSGAVFFGKTPHRNFYVPETISDNPDSLWEAETHGSYSNSSFIVYDSLLYAPDLSGRIYAFRKTNGKEIGVIKNKGEIAVAPVLKNKKIVFVLNELKERIFTVHFYSLNNGKEVVSEFNGSCRNELLVLNDKIFLLSDNGVLYKFDFNGKKIWEIKTKTESVSSPVGWNKQILWGNLKGEIVSVSEKGKITFRKKISEGFEGGVVIVNNNLIIPTVDGTLINYDLENKRIAWKFETGSGIKNFPVHNNKDIFTGTLNGKVFSVNLKTGKENWRISTGGLINTTPLLFKNVLVQPNLFKRVDFINVQNGKVIHTINLEGRAKSSPCYDSGIIYFGIDYGEILAYKVK